MRKSSMLLLAGAALPMAVNAADTEFKYGGYIKFDAIHSTYSDGEGSQAANGLGRDFYIPSLTPVTTDDAEESSSQLDMGAKASRFNFKTTTTLDNGEKVTSFVEMDFLASASGNERVSSSYNPRLRHAFFSHNNLLFGQTWSTFMNTGALPEVVDFLGVSDGTVFNRQAQVRYTNGPIQISAENPETTINVNGSRVVSDDSSLPDLVVRYNLKTDTAAISFSGIARELAYVDQANDIDETTIRFGANISGKISLGKDDLKFSVTKGDVARYVGLNMSNDATYTNGGKLVGNNVTAAFIGFRHFWTDSVRSTLAYSTITADNHEDAGTSANKKSDSVRLNLMWSPAKKMTYGVELSQATLEKESGLEGDMTRVHFTAKYVL